jgi:hypothetical protein
VKRAGNLYPLIVQPDNIRLAYWKASRGKHDRLDVIAFKNNFEQNILTLYDQLKKQSLDIGHYRFFRVYDPKCRLICAASFPERVLHHAVMNICEPLLDTYAIYDSYACRKGKGTHRAVLRAKSYARRYPWFLKLDIRKYFDSIDHDIILALLVRRFKDKAVLNIFDQIIDTYHTSPGKGLPIGNLISHHLANFYLSGFDHWIKEEVKVPGYLRYMDDFVLFETNKTSLNVALDRVRNFLARQLSLDLKDSIQLNRCKQGVPFLGFLISSDRICLLPGSKKRFVQKFKAYENQWSRGNWSLSELTRHMEPLVAFTRLADAAGFRRNVINRFEVSP